MAEKIFGVPAKKMVNLLASLVCGAVGAVFLGFGLNERILEYGIFFRIVSPLQLSLIGIGFVFLVVAVFLVREAFRDGFFDPESAWEDGIRFCEANILIWLVLFCLGVILPFIAALLLVFLW
ncbi:hypothetical protein [Methanolacinia paynteri]|uniref:hypothetical protein n=1 Tax=Methanolacinia paynteri TaxID=230356 RepID=UPI00064F8B7D|nr:hypothetical protein [Methanolacinia paynteri]